ncbi:MAG: pyridoxal-phosphate dependent enzyme, partial [Planctomycetota bacterium]|nr:pyridoxal-phosphate dependent enzyme [Planctomycetota bacterium]
MDPNRIELAQIPTPIEEVPGIFPTGTLFVKRDDLTGSTLSGNKIRKLEYLFHEARSLGKSTVLTCGGIQSNHCRATAIAAAQLGLNCILYLRTDTPPEPEAPLTGNLKLCHQVGAEVRYISVLDYQDRTRILDEAAGENGYVIPEGGSNALGAWGYIRAIDEMVDQWKTPPSSIVVATGSGGTLAGLLIGLKRRKLSIPTYGIAVCDD